ncbi:type II toxin-antitoxin system Phd/YefM family antitoxin [Cellulosimicrobium arenosum]|uniref:Antitoxin n=1 Tax=Cellulosimicrobium arenosum TaxID=2708133 RepID=A0A927PDQ5_9MICO|nr:type II toxin-antitoxin system prevent-host-death family antitoxin [Cellulosimicrobium arenosum]MBD8079788.1 type II toxin-antitoxin system prevent-host-death family antitoxin [Cellulosimicrobium arenosum]
MDVAVSALRAELKSWIERARAGEEIVVTERGIPVARLTGVSTTDLVTELTRDGVLTSPHVERPVREVASTEAVRPTVAADHRTARSSGVAALVRRIRR